MHSSLHSWSENPICFVNYTQCLKVTQKVSLCATLAILETLLVIFKHCIVVFFLVMGPTKSSYLNIAPEGSFIHTEDFPQGAKALAKYLEDLDEVIPKWAHCSKSQIFVQKFNFDKTPTFSRVFYPNFFFFFFSGNQSC